MSLRSYRLLLQARLLNVRRLRSTWKGPECEEEDNIIHWPELNDHCQNKDLKALHERLGLAKKKRGSATKAWYADEICAAMAIYMHEAAAAAKRRCSLPPSLTILASANSRFGTGQNVNWHMPEIVLCHMSKTRSGNVPERALAHVRT